MWLNSQIEFLKKEINSLISLEYDLGDFSNLLKEPLNHPKRGLAGIREGEKPWILLPLIVCDSISGETGYALPLAAARQMLLAAADLFDDIEDADSPDSMCSKYGFAVTTNLATTYLILAWKALARLKERGVRDDKIIQILDKFAFYYTVACSGQHRDISLASQTPVSEETYLRTISMKSAAQVECACHTAALLATDDARIIAAFSAFGHNLGMAEQIANDIQGVIQGKDILHRKITLPVIFALAQGEEEYRYKLNAEICDKSGSVPDLESVRGILFQTGAMHYTSLKMEYYKQLASDNLSELNSFNVNIGRLKIFLK